MKLNRELLLLMIFAIIITLVCGEIENQEQEIEKQRERADYYSDEIIKQQIEIWSLKEFIQKQDTDK